MRTPTLLLRILCSAAVAACLLYLAATISAYFLGWALPTTALIRWSPAAEWVAGKEPLLGYVLISFAGMGTLACWIAPFIPGGRNATRREEISLLRFFRRWGLPLAICAFVFSMSAMWAGIV